MDTSTKDFTINAQLLGALGSLWQGTPTQVSPFRYGKTGFFGTEEKAVLTAAGICDAGGQPSPDIRPALDVLGSAQAFTRMYITGGPNAYEYIVYFTADGRTASLINIGGNVQINCPSIADLFIGMVSQTLGSSLYRNATLEASLTPDEALVLSAMIDLQRQTFLRSLASSHESAPIIIESSSIENVLCGPDSSFQWLNNVIRELVTGENALSPQVPAALASLAEKGLVKQTGSACSLSDEAAFLARRMLVIDTSVVLTAGHLAPEGNVGVAGFTCLQAGVHDLLYIDTSAGTVDIQAISSAAVLEFIRTFMTNPDALKKLVVPSSPLQPEVSSPKRKFCPQCGAQITEGKMFCNKCGTKIR
jgi:hypothetical protein